MLKSLPSIYLVGFLLVFGCHALPPSEIQKFMDVDPRITKGVELFGERAAKLFKANISEECTNALTAIANSTLETLAYIDASGKLPSGIFEGDFLMIGSYSACKMIPDSQYCMANVLLNKISLFQNKNIPARWGVCVPSVCSEIDVAVGIEDLLVLFNLEKTILISTKPDPRSIYCAKPSDYDAGAIICLIICTILGFLCLGGTIIDMVERPFMSVKSKEENIQNGIIHHKEYTEDDNPIYNSREQLVQNGNLAPSIERAPRKKHIIMRIFKCFSIIENTKKIMDTQTAPGAINSINGMRVLSISWVVLGHTYFFLLITYVGNNLQSAEQITHRFSFQAIDNAFFSVDSFFFLSGLLVGYIGLKRMDRNNGNLPWFKFYFHRFWRLTPTYMFCILFLATLFKHVSEGPVWYINQQPTTCDTKWWTNLLYINNFYPKELGKECLGWSWYLANDMQFYIISPIFLYAMYYFRLPGLSASVGSFLVASFVATGAIIGYYHLPATQASFFSGNGGNKANMFTNYIYIKPYCRISPYLVGIALGYVFFADKTHSFIRKLQPVARLIFLAIGWSIAFICAFASLYGLYKTVKADHPVPFTETENIIYGMFSRFSWALGLAWVIYVCHSGAGGLVDSILSARFWMPLSRLTYGTYLVHPMVLMAFYGSLQDTVAYTDFLLVVYFLGCLVVSYGLSFILAIALEFPAMQLEKLFD